LTVSDYIQAGSSPSVSGSSMSGSGFIINSTGTFAFGNSTRNLSFNGSTLTMNGDMVVTGNLQANGVTQGVSGSNASQVYFPTTSYQLIATTPSVTVPNNSTGVLVLYSFYLFNDLSSGRTMVIRIQRNGTTINSVYPRIKSGQDQIITRAFFDTPSTGSVVYTVEAAIDNNATAANLNIPAGEGIIIADLFKR